MTTNRSIILICGVVALAGLTSCQRAQNADSAASGENASAIVSTNTAPPPAQNMVMVCRNSQTGQKAECGTPNAVMVGMKPESAGNTASSPN